jgi:hypothetical protein
MPIQIGQRPDHDRAQIEQIGGEMAERRRARAKVPDDL